MSAEPHSAAVPAATRRIILATAVRAGLVEVLSEASTENPDKALVNFSRKLREVVVEHGYTNRIENPHLVYVDAFGDDGSITSVYAIATSRRGELSITIGSDTSFMIKDILTGMALAGLRPVSAPKIEIRGDVAERYACTVLRFNIFDIEAAITRLQAHHVS